MLEVPAYHSTDICFIISL